MADKGRTSAQDLALRSELAEDPYGYEFFQILRLLEALNPDHPRLGRSSRAKHEVIRLGQEPSLAFPSSMVSGFSPGGGGSADRLDVLFLGLFGPNGPLPLHLTEHARQRERQSGDATFRRFADLFHHRLLSLFYRAWADAQPCVSLDRAEDDRFRVYVGSLIGLAEEQAWRFDSLDDHSRLYYSGILAMQNAPADGLETLVEDFLGVPTAVDEFVGEWVAIPEDMRLLLGRSLQTGELGSTATAGARAWSTQSKFRLVCGPMSFTEFSQLLPDRDSLPQLHSLVRSFVGDALFWELRLVLARDEVPATLLGESGQLGWTTWLGERPGQSDANDVTLRPTELHLNIRTEDVEAA